MICFGSSSRRKLNKLLLSKLKCFKVKNIEEPHFFVFPESQQIVGEKEENFQHGGHESRILDNVAMLGRSVAPDTEVRGSGGIGA